MPSFRRFRFASWLRAVSLAAAASFAATGCQSVQRRMTIRSDPPGALVLVDGREVGYTPASVDFTYYGTREITLVKDGYQTLTTLQTFKPPWYQYPGVEFVSDNFLPLTVTNRHDMVYRMRPATNPPSGELLDRAESLRGQSRIGQ